MKKIIILLLLVAAVTAAVVLAPRFRGPETTSVAMEAVKKRAKFDSFVNASGEIVATRYAEIGSSIMGRLVDLRVREGDRVTAGQVLAVIDAVQAQGDVSAQEAQIRTLEAEERVASEQIRASRSDLLAAQSREREAQSQLERTRKLVEAGVAPVSQLETAKAAAETAEAMRGSAEAAISRGEKSVEAARRRIGQAEAQTVRVQDVLTKTRITSPISGIVSRLQVRQGEMVVIGIQNQPGTTLMTISDLSSVNAEVKVAEADVVQIRIGQSSRITLEALPGRTFNGKVVEIGASALPVVGAGAAAREFKVVVRLDQPDEVLRPGLTCDTEVLVNERPGALTVPLQSVVIRPGAEGAADVTGVFVVRDDQARFVPVKTGIIGGLDIEVMGVDEGAMVVSGPVQVLRDLKDGAAVKAQP